jgi:hypothetical protein
MVLGCLFSKGLFKPFAEIFLTTPKKGGKQNGFGIV